MSTQLRPSPFAGDDGRADAELMAALAAWRQEAADLSDLVDALRTVRVLAPVAPMATTSVPGSDREHGAPGREKDASSDPCADQGPGMGVVAVAGPDGGATMPIFTSTTALAHFRPDWRPWPTTGGQAAAAALAEGWGSLVVDPAGDDEVFLPRSATHYLAGGELYDPAIVRGSEGGWQVTPPVRAALAQACAVAWVTGCRAQALDHWRVRVTLEVQPGLSHGELDELSAAVGQRLATMPMADRLDSLEVVLTSVSPDRTTR